MTQSENQYDLVVEKENRIEQKWYKSPVVWTAIIVKILYLLKTFGVFESLDITPEMHKELVTTITFVADIIAYFNNPYVKNKFK